MPNMAGIFPSQNICLQVNLDVSKLKKLFPTYLSAGDWVSNGVGIGGHIPDISILCNDFVIGFTESRDRSRDNRPINFELPFLNIFSLNEKLLSRV